MSVVAWDGRTIAADMAAERGGGIRTKVSKLRRLADGTVLGFVGSHGGGLALIEWFENGCQADKYPPSQKEDDDLWAELIVCYPDGRCGSFQTLPYFLPVEKISAWGSGGPIALGAMAVGADARTAVETAIAWQAGCGIGVEAFDLTP